MAPLNLETLLTPIVGKALITRFGVLIIEEETTAIFISFAIVRRHRQSPRPFRVNLAKYLQVDLVAQGKVVSTITQVESAVAFVTIRRHNESARITLCEGEESVRYGQR